MKWCSKKKLCRKSRVELLVWERSAKIIESNYLAASGLTKSWSMLKRYLEYWQAWGVSHRSRKCAPVFQCPHGKDVIPNAQPDPAVATLFHSHPAISGQVRAWHFILLPVRVLQGVMRLFSVSIPDWTAQVSSTSPHRTCSPALLAALLFSCGCFHIVMSFLYCETCTQCSRWSCSNAKYSGRITFLVGCAAFHAPHNVVSPLAARTHCWFVLSLQVSAPTGSLLLSCSAATHSQSVPVSGITASQLQHPVSLLNFTVLLFAWCWLLLILSMMERFLFNFLTVAVSWLRYATGGRERSDIFCLVWNCTVFSQHVYHFL